MSSETASSVFQTIALTDIMDIKGGAQPPANTFQDRPQAGYIRFVQIRDFGTDAHLTFIKQDPKWRYCTETDVLIARYGASVGRICRGVAGAYNVALVKVVPKGVNRDFLYYLLRSHYFQGPIAAMSGRSAQAGFNKSDLAAIRVPLPPRPAQDAIGLILSSLDNRIAVLRQTNDILEAIAQTLFKSWFVDFDPVRAKEQQGVPMGIDEVTAALFPDDLDQSALGAIPRGWHVQSVGDVVACIGGATPDTKDASYWQPEEHAWSTPKDLSGLPAPVLLTTERRLSTKGLAKIGSGLLPEGTLLLSSRAPIGYLAITSMPVAINQGYIAMPPGGRLPPLYMLFWCRLNMEGIKARANGSTFMEISKKAFRPIPMLVPPVEVVDAFVSIASPLFDRLVENERQAQTLAVLRDTLLPRLISGQLRLPEAEALAA